MSDFKSRKSKGNGDFFPTFHSITREFLDAINIDNTKVILEPCAGAGDMLKIFYEYGFGSYGCDLFPRGEGISQVDWLNGTQREFYLNKLPYVPDLILTNPPYNIYTEFLKACFETTISDFFFIQPLDYLHSIERHEAFFKNGYNGVYLTDVWVLVRRPKFGPEYDPAGLIPTGSITFSWFKFQRLPKNPELVRIHHIDNKECMGVPSDSPEKYKEISLLNEW